MRDALLDFGELDLSSLTIDTSTAPVGGRLFPNVIPWDDIRGDLGKGTPILACLRVEESVTTATGSLAIFVPELVLAAASGTVYGTATSSVIAGGAHLGVTNNAAPDSYCFDTLAAGKEFYFYLPPLPRRKPLSDATMVSAYLQAQIRCIIGTGAGVTNGGVVSMALLHGVQLDMDYPANFTIANP